MIARKARRGRVFGVPVLLGIVTLAGLVVGLLGDGWYDRGAAIAIVVPVAVTAWSLAGARAGRWDR